MTTAPATATTHSTSTSQAASAPPKAAEAPSDLAKAFDATADLGGSGDDADIDTDDLQFFTDVIKGGEAKPSAPSSTEKPGGDAVPASGAQPGKDALGGAVPSPAAAPASGATPAAPAAEPPAKPAEAAPVAQAPVVQEPAAAAPQAQTPEDVTKAYQTWRGDRVKALAEQSFGLTKEQVELVQTEPEKIIPHLMASAALTAMEASTQAIFQALPGIIKQITEKDSKYTEAGNKFFGAWPALKAKKDDPALVHIAQMYRQLNPTADEDTFVKTVGAMAMAQFGLAFEAPQAPTGQQPPAAPSLRPVSPFAASAPRHSGANGAQPAQGSFEARAVESGLLEPDD